ncbi:MAG: hypothetical protein SFU21_02400 [Flavihumibacter sp.]|nr:hypothetical protein [Flavihumibacter sp.]
MKLSDKSTFNNMRCFLFFIAIFCSACSTAQTVTHKKVAVKTNTPCKESTEAEFKGGSSAWVRFFYEKLKFDSLEVEDFLNQSTYHVTFVVNKEGNVSNIKIDSKKSYIQRKIEEIMQMSNGKWSPATCNKKPVISNKTIQVIICLQEEDLD